MPNHSSPNLYQNSLLEHPTDADGLRWTSDTTFEVTILDELAIAALRPEFEFRSLGSFVVSSHTSLSLQPYRVLTLESDIQRQLSYYNFKRLSDRRRSSERGTAKKGFIKFTCVYYSISLSSRDII